MIRFDESHTVIGIGSGAFKECSNLSSITIPESVTSIGGEAFYRCSSLTSIKLPENITSIQIGTFEGCSSLKNITIPEKVTQIWGWAFCECSSLESIIIPKSVTTMGIFTFYGCSSLSDVAILGDITDIQFYSFYNCSKLKTITLPESVTKIGDMVFYGCTSMTDVYFGGSKEQWKKINIGIGNEGLFNPTNIHYNKNEDNDEVDSEQPQPFQKSDQSITAKNITKTYGAKPFLLGAKSDSGTKLTYSVSDKKVATVDKNGRVVIKGCGITNITITAQETDNYNQAKKEIKLTVKPKKVTVSSVKSTKKKTVTVKWKRNKEAQGYIIQCATDSKFKNNKIQMTVNKNKTISVTVKKLKAGKKYYVRICAYAKSGKIKVQGNWSKVKTVKVKK